MKTKQDIMRLLHMKEIEYAHAVENLGYQFAADNCANCVGAVDYLVRTKAFWKWWMRHFDIRDELFLSQYGAYSVDAELDTDGYKFLFQLGVKPIGNTTEWLRKMWAESHQPANISGRIPDPAWQQMLTAIREEEDAPRPVYKQPKKENIC
jgi:hypothetical protein